MPAAAQHPPGKNPETGRGTITGQNDGKAFSRGVFLFFIYCGTEEHNAT